MKGKRIIISVLLQGEVLNQLYMNITSLEKSILWACESMYWINMNTDTEGTVKKCHTYLVFQVTPPKDKIISHEISGKLWDLLEVIFSPLITSIGELACITN